MTKLNQTYIIGHWGLTLLIAPFISEAIESVFGKNPHQIAGLLEFYPITLVFSIIFLRLKLLGTNNKEDLSK